MSDLSTGDTTADAPASNGHDPEDWRHGLDDDVARLIDTKGWKTPGDVVQSYANLERLLGAERLAVPAPDDLEGLREAMRRLGAPEDAAGYDLAPPEDAPDGWYRPEAAERFRALAHEAGLTTAQARLLHDGWVATLKDGEAATEQAQAAAERALDEELQRDWGSRYQARLDLARRAAARFGQAADLDALETRIGAPQLVRLFAAIGEQLGEDALVGQGDGPLGGSAAAALAEIGQLKLDPSFMAALAGDSNPGHGEAKAKWRRLHDLAYPGMIGA